MPNNITIGDNIIIAKANISFINAGVTLDNTKSIHELAGASTPSYEPGRIINGIDEFVVNKAYLLKALQAFDLSAVTVPPLEPDPQLETPTGFEATATNYYTITLLCDEVDNATSYRFEKANNEDFAGVSLVYEGPNNYATAAPLADDTHWYFRLVAKADDYTTSEYAYADASTPAEQTVATAPVNFIATPTTVNSGNSFALTWDVISGYQYDYDIATDEDFTNIVRNGVGVTNHVTQNFFPPDLPHYFRIKARVSGLEDSDYVEETATSGKMYAIEIGNSSPQTVVGITFTPANFTTYIEMFVEREADLTGTPVVMTIQESGVSKVQASFPPSYTGKTFIYYETDGTKHTDTFASGTKNYT